MQPGHRHSLTRQCAGRGHAPPRPMVAYPIQPVGAQQPMAANQPYQLPTPLGARQSIPANQPFQQPVGAAENAPDTQPFSQQQIALLQNIATGVQNNLGANIMAAATTGCGPQPMGPQNTRAEAPFIATDTPYTQDNINFFRCCGLLLEEGTKALRLELESEICNYASTFPDFLKDINVFNRLEYLKQRNILNVAQVHLLYPGAKLANSFPDKNYYVPFPDRLPTAQDTSQLDITLLSLLYQDVCAHVMQQTKKMPLDQVVRKLREKRNELYAHVKSASISHNEFVQAWDDLKNILKGMKVAEDDIDKWRTHPLSLGDAYSYQIQMKQLLQNDAFQEFAEVIRNNFKLLSETLTAHNSKIGGTEANMQQLQQQLSKFSAENIVDAINQAKEQGTGKKFKDLENKLEEHYLSHSKEDLANTRTMNNICEMLSGLTSEIEKIRKNDSNMSEAFQKNLEDMREVKLAFETTTDQRVREIQNTQAGISQLKADLESTITSRLREFDDRIQTSKEEICRVQKAVEDFTNQNKKIEEAISVLINIKKDRRLSTEAEWPQNQELGFYKVMATDDVILESEWAYSLDKRTRFSLRCHVSEVSMYNISTFKENSSSAPSLRDVTKTNFKRMPSHVVPLTSGFTSRPLPMIGSKCDISLVNVADDTALPEEGECKVLVNLIEGQSDAEVCDTMAVIVVPNTKHELSGEWSIVHADEIVDFDWGSFTESIEGKTPEYLSIAAEFNNLERILVSQLDDNMFIALVNAMQVSATLSFKSGNSILEEQTRSNQVRKLAEYLQTCPRTEWNNFVKLFCLKRETFIMGFQLFHRRDYLRRIESGEAPKPLEDGNANESNSAEREQRSGTALMKIRHRSSAGSQELIWNNLASFEESVITGVDGLQSSSSDPQEEREGFYLLLKKRSAKELKHLRLDVKYGAFARKYIEWVKVEGGEVPDGDKLQVTLYGVGETVLDCKATVCYTDGQEDDEPLEIDPNRNDDLLAELSDFEKEVITERLMSKGEAVPTALFSMQLIFLKRILLYQCTESEVLHFLSRLESRQVLSIVERSSLEMCYRDNRYGRVFIEDLVTIMSGKNVQNTVDFIYTLSEMKSMSALGMRMTKVLAFCKEVKNSMAKQWHEARSEKKKIKTCAQEPSQVDSEHKFFSVKTKTDKTAKTSDSEHLILRKLRSHGAFIMAQEDSQNQAEKSAVDDEEQQTELSLKRQFSRVPLAPEEETEELVAAEVPVAVNKPVAIESMVAKKESVATEEVTTKDKEPVALKEAVATDEPVAKEKVVTADIPVAMEETVAKEAMVVKEESIATEKVAVKPEQTGPTEVVAKEKLVAIKEAVATEQPVAKEDLVAMKEAVAIKQPVDIKEPVATKQPVYVKEEIAIKEQVATEKSVDREELVDTKETVATEQTVAKEELVATKEAVAAEQPDVTEMPNAKDLVAIKEKVATGKLSASKKKFELSSKSNQDDQVYSIEQSAKISTKASSNVKHNAVFDAIAKFQHEYESSQDDESCDAGNISSESEGIEEALLDTSTEDCDFPRRRKVFDAITRFESERYKEPNVENDWSESSLASFKEDKNLILKYEKENFTSAESSSTTLNSGDESNTSSRETFSTASLRQSSHQIVSSSGVSSANDLTKPPAETESLTASKGHSQKDDCTSDLQEPICVFNPMVSDDETKLISILNKDFQEQLWFISVSLSNDKPKSIKSEKRRADALSLLFNWRKKVEEGVCSWKDFHSCLSKYHCNAAANQFRVLYERDRLVCEKELLESAFETRRGLVEKLVKNGVINVVEKSRIETRNDSKEAVEYFVSILLPKSPLLLSKFHDVLREESFPLDLLNRFVL